MKEDHVEPSDTRIGGDDASLDIVSRAACLARIDELQKLHAVDVNPLRIWEALLQLTTAYRGAKAVPLPAWMANYLNGSALALQHLADRVADPQKPDSATVARNAISAALGFTSQGSSVFQQLREERKAFAAYDAYVRARHVDRLSESEALMVVATAIGVGEGDPKTRRSQAKKLVGAAGRYGFQLSTEDEVRQVWQRYSDEARRIVESIDADSEKT